ncbi:MAG: ribose 5-phosphate isomerase B [Candidatus Omnitrophica bacterium]|nr:ribose 5-phosphate isomerase B [Candidatus Omnitrophota bacterium]
MKIFIGADHRGYLLKSKIVAILEKAGHDVVDAGTHTAQQSCDYPLVAYGVASRVSRDKNSRGILICMSGNGQVIAANKVKGAYAALCYNLASARLCRQHNNANILVIGAMSLKAAQLKTIVTTWLATPFEGGRHLRRFKMIQKIEQGENPDTLNRKKAVDRARDCGC